LLVGGAILPHPPIILPAYAADRGAEVDQTIAAVQAACRWLADELRPDRFVIASPHEGHGFTVPLHFIREAFAELPPHRRLLTAEPSYAAYLKLGEELRAEETPTLERVAVIASGDCSHRLKQDGPYGFHPNGPKLDEAILAGVQRGSAQALLEIPPDLVRDGAECGLGSFIFALTAAQPSAAEILSYQAPYGVGYLVAAFQAGAAGSPPPAEAPPQPPT